MGRRIFSLIGCLAAVALAIASGRSGASLPSLAPPSLPPMPGEVAPAGELRVDGRQVRASTYRSATSPEEEIARHRALWRDQPVDLVELPLPGGRLLSIVDNRSGRQLVVAALRRSDGVEVVRGDAPVVGPSDDEWVLPLPDDWRLASSVEDRLGQARMRTQTFVVPRGPGTARRELERLLLQGGWSPDEGTGGFRRGGARLALHLDGEDGAAVVQLQLLEETR